MEPWTYTDTLLLIIAFELLALLVMLHNSRPQTITLGPIARTPAVPRAAVPCHDSHWSLAEGVVCPVCKAVPWPIRKSNRRV